jgi:hypothetical protein
VGDFLAWLDAAQPANLAALADLVAPLREERP